MYAQYTEQLRNSMKPFTALMEINVKTFEAIAEKQTSFFTTTMNDGLAYTQDITSQTDLASVLKVQKEYSEDFQEKLMATSKEMYSTMVEASNKINGVMKGAFIDAREMATEMAATSPAKTTKSSRKSTAK